MTLAVVVMIGAGVLLIISAIEDSSIIATFQAIWTGAPITGLAPSTGSTGSTGSTTTGTPKSSTTQAL